MKNKMIVVVILFLGAVVQADQFDPVLDGHYSMKLKVGDKIFDDEMEFRGADRPIRLRDGGGRVQGSITVPGVFTSPLEGHGFCSTWGSQCHLIFTIVAREQGQTYKVRYEALLEIDNYLKVLNQGHQPILTGSAYFENGQVLGTFEAIRK